MKTYDVVVIQANERAIGCNHHLGINTCAHAIHHVAQVQLLRTRATWRGARRRLGAQNEVAPAVVARGTLPKRLQAASIF